jgi:TolB-like protein/copper chaperone CopZ
MEPSGNAGVTQMNKMTARGALEQYLVNSRRYRVVDRSRIDQIMKEQTFARDGLVNAANVKEIGKMLQADIVCSTEMRKEEGAFIALCSLIDVESGEVSASAYELIESDTAVEIRDAMNRAAMTMLGLVDSSSPAHKTPAAPTAKAGDSLQDPRQARIAVIVPEEHIGRPIPDPAAETAIIRKLTEAGFTRVVDKNQVNKIRESDAVKALLSGDVAAATGIGQQLGVDYLMVGEAFSEAVGPVGGGLFSCRARAEARIIRTDNARIIAANDSQVGGIDMTENMAAKKALNNAGELMGDYMVKQLLSVGGSSASGIKLTATGAYSFSKVSELEKALKSIKGVDSVRINEYGNSVATIDVTTKLSAQALAASIGNIGAPRMEVIEASGSAIKVQMR